MMFPKLLVLWEAKLRSSGSNNGEVRSYTYSGTTTVAKHRNLLNYLEYMNATFQVVEFSFLLD